MASQIEIRAAASADVDAIGRVHVTSWRETYAGVVPDDYLARLDPKQRAAMWTRFLAQCPERGRHLIVAVEHGEVIGFAGSAARAEGDPDEAELLVLYLLKRAHGRGIGRRLMSDLVHWLQHDGFTRLWLWVLADNPTRGFYEHLGGRLTDETQIELDGAPLTEVAYVWDDLSLLSQIP